MTSHVRKESVDGSVETHPHSVMIDNRHLAFVVVTVLDWTPRTSTPGMGLKSCFSTMTPQNLVMFRHSTIKLRLLRLISVDPTQKLIWFYHLTERQCHPWSASTSNIEFHQSKST